MKHDLTLINGSFSISESKNLLLTLLNQKINFHELEMFSNEVRFGRDPDNSKKRIEELEQSRQKLIEWLETIDASANLMINGIVHLEVKLGNPA